jgi:RNA polymerase sigma-54 factor
MLNQKQLLKQQQKLSPQQILLMKLLQIPTAGLEQRIKQEVEDNPALEMEAPEESQKDSAEEDTFGDLDQEEGNGEDYEGEDDYSRDDEPDLDYLNDDDDFPIKTNNQHGPDDEEREIPVVSETTFHDYLIQQLGMRSLTPKQYDIGLYIIGNLDDSGYLRRSTDSIVDDLAFNKNLEVTKEEVEEVLKIIQDFDPVGVGARDLRECLLIQMRKKLDEEPSKEKEIALKILSRYFNEFTKKHYDKIIKRLDITEDELKDAIEEIKKLNPKPGNSLGETASKGVQYIIPDFTVTNNNGQLELSLNSWNMPDLHVSRSYSDLYNEIKSGKKDKRTRETLSFIKKKVDSAKWFIDAIKQRQNTLYDTMKAIMDYQKEYFLTGDESKLKPMILKDIADKIGMDISTISRVANSKYVQTDFGTFLLKKFFSESLITKDGKEVSSHEIKKHLKDLVDAEDKKKPLTDEKLAELLGEKGYNIARRTIAKYREQLGIPVARLRKEL